VYDGCKLGLRACSSYMKRCTRSASDWQLVLSLLIQKPGTGIALQHLIRRCAPHSLGLGMTVPGVTGAHIQRARQAFSTSEKLSQYVMAVCTAYLS